MPASLAALPAVDLRLLRDLLTFGRAHVASGDIDPVYPVLAYVSRALVPDGAPDAEERRLWLLSLYLGYYSLSSALIAFRHAPTPRLLTNDLLKLPTATERRGHRDVRQFQAWLASHLSSTATGHRAFITAGWGADPVANFRAFWAQAQTITGNGRWAAFKWADLLLNVHGYPLAFPDLCLKDCSGPKDGLRRLYPAASDDLATLEACATDLLGRCHAAGAPWRWDQLETILCDFNSLCKGHYYVGHDIDQMQEQMAKAALTLPERTLLDRARAGSFPPAYLGERHGWIGVDRERRSLYCRRGLIAVRGRARGDANGSCLGAGTVSP